MHSHDTLSASLWPSWPWQVTSRWLRRPPARPPDRTWDLTACGGDFVKSSEVTSLPVTPAAPHGRLAQVGVRVFLLLWSWFVRSVLILRGAGGSCSAVDKDPSLQLLKTTTKPQAPAWHAQTPSPEHQKRPIPARIQDQLSPLMVIINSLPTCGRSFED